MNALVAGNAELLNSGAGGSDAYHCPSKSSMKSCSCDRVVGVFRRGNQKF
jgi:hypothetical protein